MPAQSLCEPLQIEQKALTKMRAVAPNIDFVSVSEKAPASAFAWVAVRARIICCYASAIPQPICEALAELFSCRPNRAARCYLMHGRLAYPVACDFKTACDMLRLAVIGRIFAAELQSRQHTVCIRRGQFRAEVALS
jgi:hypothetical protein